MYNLINIYMCKPNKQLQYACPLKIRGEILMLTSPIILSQHLLPPVSHLYFKEDIDRKIDR